MPNKPLSRATLGRLPEYISYLRLSVEGPMVSAATMARALGYGEVLVRRDLNAVCAAGRPKVGFPVEVLMADIEEALGVNDIAPVVVVGAGRLGRALQQHRGFRQYGFEIVAGFDISPHKWQPEWDHPVLPMEELSSFCRENEIRMGIITVPAAAAQQVCDSLVDCGITAIWNFAPCRLSVPEQVTLKQEDLALSLAHLSLQARLREKE